MRVGFFSPRSLNPLHPRLKVYEKYFGLRGDVIEFINESPTGIKGRINWLTLWFFDLYAISRCKNRLKDFDLIIIGDLRYLPLIRYATKLGKIAFYETIDHNVDLRFYHLSKKIPVLLPFKVPIIRIFRLIEKFFAFKANQILVNSDSLCSYFDHRAVVLYYSSPLEKYNIKNNPLNESAWLYLGVFTTEKGADSILRLIESCGIPFYFFGEIPDEKLKQRLLALPNVFLMGKLSSDQLGRSIQQIVDQYFLWGISMISSVHYSYEVQEANKDIDYLALGIPIIGNYRITTGEKINAGCGLFWDDQTLSVKVKDPSIKKSLSEAGKEYYLKKYKYEITKGKLDAILSHYDFWK